ncbi:MAG: hypothetical protein JWM11_3059 [Planctomycetaceae bacterium]|nr:hypothetical protein [Planctomycetaceae bacterium]
MPDSIKRRWWPVIKPAAKWCLLMLVLAAVLLQARTLGVQIDWAQISIRPGWLALSILLYIAGWLPAVWFWGELIREVGCRVSWFEVAKAYYCGHLGKYVPGKAGVIFIRAGMLRTHGVPVGPGALSAGYETLASMAAGAAVGFALLPTAVDPELLGRILHWIPGGALIVRFLPWLVLAGSLLGLPILSRVFDRILKKMVPAEKTGGAAISWAHQPSWTAFLLLVLGWWIHGLSMGCTIQAITPEPVSWSDLPRWTAATSLCIVLGFLALFSPGGLGVREIILLEILEPSLGPLALVATLLSRLTWLAGECAAAGVLYYWPWQKTP